jgi:hypothetical protein
MQIGGTTKLKKPTQPQFVVQKSGLLNEYLKLGEQITWVGDPNSATKFDSKYQAKTRVRELVDVPETRCFKELEG